MIKLSDSQLLANTKFKTYKGRSILTVITLSIGIIALSTIIIALTGVYDVIKISFKDNLKGKYFVKAQYNCYAPGLDGTCPKFDKDRFLKKFSDFKFKNIYEEKSSPETQNYTYGIDGIEIVKNIQINSSISISNNRVVGISTTNEAFTKDNVRNEDAFSKDQEGAIPVIIPESLLDPELSPEKAFLLKEKTYYDLHTAALDKYIGKKYYISQAKIEYKLNSKDNSSELDYSKMQYVKTPVQVVIVGLIPSKSSLFGFSELISNKIYIPDWSVENSNVKELLKNSFPDKLYLEFESKAAQNKFAADYYSNVSDETKDTYFNNFYIQTIQSSYEQITSIVNVLRNVGIGVGIFFIIVVSLFIFTTVSKITSDGRKEIAIFRSYGAEKSDIRKIFNTYIILITNTGFSIGLVIGVILTIILSIYQGEAAFYSLVVNGSNYNVDKPMFFFLGKAYLPIFLLYVGTLLVSLFAGVIPVFRASNIQPIVALRDE